jgi:hypothetical protein
VEKVVKEIAYNKVAEKLHGKFAHLNKIEGVEVNG